MARCPISPSAFTMAMEVVIRASRWVVGRELMKASQRLPPIRAFMDDLTTLTTTKACTKASPREAAGQHQHPLNIKPSKSRSISVVKGKLAEHCFYIGGDAHTNGGTMLPLGTQHRWTKLGRTPSAA